MRGKEPIDNLTAKAESQDVGNKPVKDFMKRKIFTLSPGTRLDTAINMFRMKSISGAPVCDARGTVVGIMSEYDLLIQAASKQLTDPIEFQTQVITLPENSILKDALVLMYKNRIRRIPIVNAKNQLLGIVSQIDILCEIVGPGEIKTKK